MLNLCIRCIGDIKHSHALECAEHEENKEGSFLSMSNLCFIRLYFVQCSLSFEVKLSVAGQMATVITFYSLLHTHFDWCFYSESVGLIDCGTVEV